MKNSTVLKNLFLELVRNVRKHCTVMQNMLNYHIFEPVGGLAAVLHLLPGLCCCPIFMHGLLLGEFGGCQGSAQAL